MINFITGTVTEISENQIVVESHGIGYEISVSSKTLIQKGNIGDKVTVLTYLCVREDGFFLYGFCNKDEKTMFLRLIEISGIGPKVALSILSGIGVDELCACVLADNFKRLSQIKGVGRKTAERIILELKDKIKGNYDGAFTAEENADEDAVLALMSMGFSKQEALSAAGRVAKEGLTTQEIIIEALKTR